MPDKILGLDIGDSSVKAVQVTGGLKGYVILDCAHVDIDPDAGLSEALERLFQEAPFDNGTSVASFQGDGVAFRNLVMPFKDRKRIEQTLGYELEPLLPFAVEDMATAYVGTSPVDEANILSASVQKEALSQHLEILGAHRIDPAVVDLSAVATAAQVGKLEDAPAHALCIDVGQRTTLVVLLIESTVALVRSFPFGGDSATRSIATSNNISHEEAERMKCAGSLEGLDSVLAPMIQSLCEDIQNTLHAYRYQGAGEARPERIFLTGGGALLPGVAAMLEDILHMPVELLDLAEATNAEMEERAAESWNPLLMNSALALALRDTKGSTSFNFRVGALRKQRRYAQFLGDAKRIGIYAAIIVLVLLANTVAGYYAVKKRHDHLKQEVIGVYKRTFPDAARIPDPVGQMKVKVREAKESVLAPTDFSGSGGATIDLLRDISLRIPPKADVGVSSLVLDENKVRLKGLTDNFNTVDAIKNGLQESSYFKDVSIASAQIDRKTEKVRFEVIMEM